MIRSAITVSLVEEARGGPFVFWNGIADAAQKASQLGFDAIEIFAPGPDAVDTNELNSLLEQHNLSVAAVGTGAGMVKHGLYLTDQDADRREKARNFIRSMIEFGAPYQAPAIIGSMQGRWGNGLSRDAALELLAESLNDLGAFAADQGVPLIYEPLNRYETNLICRIADGVDYLKTLKTDNVKLLADLFHMQIEEADLAEAIQAGQGFIGHVHFVDSNRSAAGMGHMDFGPIADALKATGYDGYASAECFPLPDSETAAENTIAAYKKYFG